MISQLKTLAEGLPTSIPLAKKGDKIEHVLANATGDDAFHTFNRRYDALFGLDCRRHGRMIYVHRGERGMLAYCRYLESIDLSDKSLQLSLMELRLSTLIAELQLLM